MRIEDKKSIIAKKLKCHFNYKGTQKIKIKSIFSERKPKKLLDNK